MAMATAAAARARRKPKRRLPPEILTDTEVLAVPLGTLARPGSASYNTVPRGPPAWTESSEPGPVEGAPAEAQVDPGVVAAYLGA